MMKTLSVSALKIGTVIDHILPGQALKIIHLFKINTLEHTITLGLNLTSASMGLKDLIKLEGHFLHEVQMQEIALFAPKGTINIIKDFIIVKKIKVSLPSSVSRILVCPNPNCITRHEPIKSFFEVKEYGKAVKLHCTYCEKQFIFNQMSWSGYDYHP